MNNTINLNIYSEEEYNILNDIITKAEEDKALHYKYTRASVDIVLLRFRNAIESSK